MGFFSKKKGQIMTHKKKISILLISAVVLIFIVGFVLKDFFLLPMFYKSNKGFGEEANYEIKSLVLNSIKDRHSTLFSLEKSRLYAESLAHEQEYTAAQANFFFIDIDDNFMQSLEKKDDKYSVKVCLNFPDDWQYYYTVEEHNGKYIISDFEIDS